MVDSSFAAQLAIAVIFEPATAGGYRSLDPAAARLCGLWARGGELAVPGLLRRLLQPLRQRTRRGSPRPVAPRHQLQVPLNLKQQQPRCVFSIQCCSFSDLSFWCYECESYIAAPVRCFSAGEPVDNHSIGAPVPLTSASGVWCASMSRSCGPCFQACTRPSSAPLLLRSTRSSAMLPSKEVRGLVVACVCRAPQRTTH